MKCLHCGKEFDPNVKNEVTKSNNFLLNIHTHCTHCSAVHYTVVYIASFSVVPPVDKNTSKSKAFLTGALDRHEDMDPVIEDYEPA